MFGVLNAAEIEQLLERQVIGRISCSKGDNTYVVPISYAYDGVYVYCHTHEGMKIDYMRLNPNVCFEVDYLLNMANWQSVVAWGTFEELTDPEQRRKALIKLHERILPFIASETVRLSPDWPFPPEELNNIPGITFRIRLTAKTGRFEMTDSESFYAS
jgi:nitroimidazol reductase NimA-like FMN-containing flavoprotein (pyridoxamine 5'-phosphate oxidase superfamily)